MKNLKRITKCSFAIILAMIMLFAVACKKSSTNDDYEVTPRPEAPDVITFYSQRLDLTVGDKVQNSAYGYKVVAGQTLYYQSENPSIATVDSLGNVEAINEGTTKIVAIYGTTKAECPVTVNYEFGELPSIVTSFAENSTFNVTQGSTYKFEPTISYRGIEFTDATFNYEISNNEALEVAGDGIVKALKAGEESQVTITASWRDFNSQKNPSLTTVVTLKVVDDVVIDVAGLVTDFVNVYTVNSFAGQTFANEVNFVPTVKINGQNSTSNPVVKIADEDLATYEGGKIIGKAYGQTAINVEVGEGEDKVVKQYTLNVLRPQAKLNKDAKYFSAQKGTLRDETASFAELTLAQFIFGAETDKVITDATVNGQQLTIKENKVFGITGSTDSTYEVTVNVGTATEVYEVDMVVYGMYIYELSDLEIFTRSQENREIDCYVELARDLDAEGFTLTSHYAANPESKFLPTISKSYKEARGFMGTFDGKGHTIKNLTTGKYGLMCVVYEATIKNVAFEDVNIKGGGLFADNVMFSNFENVYIKVASMDFFNGGSNVIARFVLRGGFFKNIYVNAEAIERESDSLHGAFGAIEIGRVGVIVPTFENCFILSDLPVGISTNSTWGQVAMAENVYAKTELKEEMLNFVWDNTAFASMKKTIETDLGYTSESGIAIDSNARAHKLAGVRAYASKALVQADPDSLIFFDSFIAEPYWALLDGIIVWGKVDLNAEKGQIYLNVGSVSGQMVEGFNGNPIVPNIGDKVVLNKLSCFGYKFIGWKHRETGIIITPDQNGEYVVTTSYDGTAMEFVAMWEKDANVSTGPEIEL